MSRILALLALLMVGLSGCASEAAVRTGGECRLTEAAQVPLRSARNFLLAPVSVNGQPRLFVVDTGAQASTVTPEAADDLALPRDGRRSTTLLGVSGSVRSVNVIVRRFAVGDLLRTDKSFSVGTMPPFPNLQPPVAGLLGADVLADYDVDIDLPRGLMTLYGTNHCQGYIPFAARVSVPLQRADSGLAYLDAMVDGRRVRALLDTGARTTLLSRRTAEVLGVTEAILADDPERKGMGIGMAAIDLHRHRFAELGLPGGLQHDVPIDIADMRLPGVEMLLGVDYLGPQRTWISYSTGRLFVR
jgi:predicted aspartyl protease